MSHDQEDWLVYTRVDWGYGRVTVHDGYSLTFEFVLSKVRVQTALHSARAGYLCRRSILPPPPKDLPVLQKASASYTIKLKT